jgi:hypothetical protein
MSRRPNRVLLLPAGVIGIALAVGIVVLIVAGLSGGGQPSPASGGSAGVDVGSRSPSSYLIVYQVDNSGAHQWEVLSVQRPFAASDLIYTTSGTPGPHDSATSGNISTMTNLYAVDSHGVRLVSGRQPVPPSGDEYLGAEISELTRRGLAMDAGPAPPVAGRRCEMFRFSGPPTGAIAALGTGSDHDDLCIDEEGLVLSEVWTYHGKVARQRTAVEVRTSSTAVVVDAAVPTAPSTDGAIPPTVYAATIHPDPQPSTFIAAPAAPAGFQQSGPAVDFRFPDPNNPSQTAAASVVWAFTSGAHLIEVEAGSERGALPWTSGDTVTDRVTLKGLGAAETAVRSDGFELRIDLGGGQWVRVEGNVPLADLIAYGHRLSRASAAQTAG